MMSQGRLRIGAWVVPRIPTGGRSRSGFAVLKPPPGYLRAPHRSATSCSRPQDPKALISEYEADVGPLPSAITLVAASRSLFTLLANCLGTSTGLGVDPVPSAKVRFPVAVVSPTFCLWSRAEEGTWLLVPGNCVRTARVPSL